MLVLENSDEEILYLAKGLPRDWVASEKGVSIHEAPTRWGRVSFNLIMKQKEKSVVGKVELNGNSSPKEVQFKLRTPLQHKVTRVTVNGEEAELGGIHRDSVVIPTGHRKEFEIVGWTT